MKSDPPPSELIRQFERQARAFKRHYGTGNGEEVSQRAIAGLLDYVAKPEFDRVRGSTRFNPAARAKRSFEVEHRRLLEFVRDAYAEMAVRSLPLLQQQMRRAAPESKELARRMYRGEWVDNVLRILEARDCPGDGAAAFVAVYAERPEWLERNADVEYRDGGTPYEGLDGCLAMLGFLVHAKRSYAEGRVEEAWLLLLDATFHVGALRGVALMRRIAPSVARKRAAGEAARKKGARHHGKLQPVKDRVAELFVELRPNGGWKTGGHAARDIEPRLGSAAMDLIREKGLKAECARLQRLAKLAAAEGAPV